MPGPVESYWREQPTSRGGTVSQGNSTINFFNSKGEIAEYVSDRIRNSKPGSQLTITMGPARSGGFCVSTATVMSSDDTLIPKSSSGLDVT